MAVSKVILNGDTLIDLTSDTATTGSLLSGITAHDNSGSSITGTIASKTSTDITVNGPTVTIPAGAYSGNNSVTIPQASINSSFVWRTDPTISLNSNTGVVTAEIDQEVQGQLVTQSGYANESYIYLNPWGASTYQLPTKSAATYTPTTTAQTIASGQYLTGAQTIAGDANLIPANIASGVSIFGVNGTHSGGGGVDTSNDTVTESVLLSGYTAHNSAGAQITGTLTLTGVDGGPEIEIYDHADENGDWVRPSTWADITALPLPEDGVYLTYDLTRVEDPWISIDMMNGSSSGSYIIERGTISGSTFTVVETFTGTGEFSQMLDISNGSVQYFRVTSSSNITWLQFGWHPTYSSSTYIPSQPCVERYGQLPYLTSPSQSSASYFNTRLLESDNLIIGNSTSRNLSLQYLWSGANSLQNYQVSFGSGICITSLINTWNSCYSLKKLNLNNWDTTNWAVTSLSYAWGYCYSLKELNIDNWNTVNWNVTTLNFTWVQCQSLKKLNLNNWNTSNWAVTSITSTWADCRSLKELDIGTWNTTNWAVTALSSAWANCRLLKELDIGTWNTTNWAVTTMLSAWADCELLNELDLKTWTTTNWPVKSLQYAWQNCYSLKELNIGNWNTSNWAVTNLYGAWMNCYSLKELNIGNWDTSNWAVTSITSMFASCKSLQSIDISLWDTTKFNVTPSSVISEVRALRYLNLSTLSFSPTSTSTVFSNYTYMFLTDFYPPTTLTNANLNFSQSMNLTHASVMRIINALPTIASTKTLTLSAVSKDKLTDAEKAIATQKGWTIA